MNSLNPGNTDSIQAYTGSCRLPTDDSVNSYNIGFAKKRSTVRYYLVAKPTRL